MLCMVDVQSRKDNRKIQINKVGVKGLHYPIVVLDKQNKFQHTIADISLFADLAHNLKGTHMSRFIQIFNRYSADFSMENFLEMLKKIKNTLHAQNSFGEVSFPYFIEKEAPVSKEKSKMNYVCEYIGEVREEKTLFYIGIQVPVTTVCPCSKDISARGAHNQRGIVRVKLCLDKFFWIEDIISLIEKSASSELFTLLKREDEKYITERAFDNPRFVEDLVRDVTQRIEKMGQFPWFSVEAENFESIHNHSAYAYVERGNKNYELAE
ncbi:MAG: GTP cyclohydrolase I FolE2 [Spirochaetales bacterium]|nr:MAG: GTP cyclohydrolase I FolE2 [Spirochaetales bacterium]